MCTSNPTTNPTSDDVFHGASCLYCVGCLRASQRLKASRDCIPVLQYGVARAGAGRQLRYNLRPPQIGPIFVLEGHVSYVEVEDSTTSFRT
jgi:hypothetical protein